MEEKKVTTARPARTFVASRNEVLYTKCFTQAKFVLFLHYGKRFFLQAGTPCTSLKILSLIGNGRFPPILLCASWECEAIIRGVPSRDKNSIKIPELISLLSEYANAGR